MIIVVKNKFEVRGEVTAIYLNSNKYGEMETLISTNKLPLVKEYTGSWYANLSKKTNTFYAMGNTKTQDGKRTTILLHRLVTGAPSGMDVDHFNHDTLDNTESNLRIVTGGENKQNRKGPQKNSKSGIRGVHWHQTSSRWCVRLGINKKKVDFGTYATLEEAEKVAIQARSKYMPYSQEANEEVHVC